MADTDVPLVGRVGPMEVDWPRTVGYFGGAALAVAVGMVEAPLAVAIVAVPFVKMLNDGRMPRVSRFVGHVFEGATKPIGGDAEGTIRLAPPPSRSASARPQMNRSRRRTATRSASRRRA